MNKRPAYIENAYNKNLNARKRSLTSSLPETATNSTHNMQQQIMNNHEILTLYSEKTDVTDLLSVLNELEKAEQSDDDDDDRELK